MKHDPENIDPVISQKIDLEIDCYRVYRLVKNGYTLVARQKFEEILCKRYQVEDLETYFKSKVIFAADCIGPSAETALQIVKKGEIILLENTRFYTEEEENDPKFAASLAALADLFCNDAFSASHRAHASTTGLAKYLP